MYNDNHAKRRGKTTYDKDKYTKLCFLFPKLLTERMDEIAVHIGVSRSQLLVKSTKEYLQFIETQYNQSNTGTI
jgi:hypothetical protein